LKPKHVVIATLVAAWLGTGAWGVRYVAGGLYLASHKTDPRKVEASTWSDYWADYSDERPERKKLQGSMAVALALIYGVPLAGILVAMQSKGRSLHGDARWARRAEVEEAGLLADDGIVLGKLGDRFLMMNDPKFVFLCAPTRSGKGVGTIIPNLLNWGDSTIVVDIKGENFQKTSGFRAHNGQKVFKFAPFDDKFETHCWNPLSYVNRDPRFVVGDLQGKGYMLYPKKDGQEGFFNDQARNIFVGLSLYCIESNIHLTIGEILRRSNGGGRAKEFWQAVCDKGLTEDGTTQLTESCLNALRQFAGTSDNTLTSILATFNAPLGVFANPIVDAATSRDDFDLREVRRSRMSIYVVIPAPKLAEAALLVNLFFSIAIDENTQVLPEQDETLKVKCLLVLDEFPALGRVDKYAKSIGYIAGYGLRVLTIAQSLSQLKDRDLYGEEGTNNLVTNHLIQVMYAPREQKECQEYSEILGYLTEKGVSKGTSQSKGSNSRSENVSEQKRALMLPQELREMGPERVIVISDNCKPIFAEKIVYYQDKAFADRLLPTVKVAPMDIDTHLAKREGRVRDLQPEEQIVAGKIAINLEAMPKVTSPHKPIAAEVKAMADFLFTQIKWTGEHAQGLAA
jgi:type IV secretion system protein VirD4